MWEQNVSLIVEEVNKCPKSTYIYEYMMYVMKC
jgi:hypothetical protein